MNKKIITYAISAFTICGGLFFSGTNAIQYDISPIRVGTKDVAYSIENLNGIGTFFATTEYSGVYFYWSLYNTTNPNVTTLYEITDPLKNTFTGSITGTVGSDEIEFGITPFHRNEYNYKDTPHRVNGDYKVDIKLLSGDEVLNTTGATITGLKFASIELFGEKHQSLNNLSFQINWKHELAPVSIRELSGTCQLIIDNEEHLCYTTNHLNNWDDGFEDVDIVIDENKISHNEGTGYIKMDILNRRYEPIDSDTLYFTYNNNTETTYTVKHYKQGVNGFYSTTPDESETFTGLVDDIVTPPTETYTGFTSPNTQTGIILPDGGLTINYYYTRNSYTVTYDTAGGDPIPSTGVLFEASIPTPTPSKNGFSFNTWLGLPSGGKMPATGITLTADWIENTNPGDPSTPEQTIASYTVKHYKQSVNGLYSFSPDESETFTGLVGDIVTPNVKSYTGFTSPSTKSGTILSGGELTINYLYTRNSYTVTYDTAGGDPIPSTGVLFEASIPTPTPSKNGFSFNTWLGLPSGGKMPATGITLTADWTESTNPGGNGGVESGDSETTYTVKHFKQDVNGNDWSLADTDNFTGIVDDIVTPPTETYIGFTSPNTQTGAILSGGELTINYYYTRNTYTVSYNSNGGNSIPSENVMFEGIIPTPTPSKAGYSFNGWSGLPTSGLMPANDISLTANWTANSGGGNGSSSSSSSSKGGSSGKSHSSGETQNKTGTTISSGTITQHVNAATGENYTMKYISRSCKPYNIEYIPELNAYTSPDLKKKEYFVNFDYLKRYVDSKNAQNAECYIERTWVTTGYIDMNDYTDRYIAPNGKIYFINEKNGYYMSSQLSSPKTFETIGELKKYIKDRNPLTSMLIYPKPSATPREFGNMSLKNSSSTNGITTNTIDNKKDEDALSELRNELLSD